MTDIPTESAWIKTCLDLGFCLADVKRLRQIYKKTYPQKDIDTDVIQVGLVDERQPVGNQTVKNSGKKIF